MASAWIGSCENNFGDLIEKIWQRKFWWYRNMMSRDTRSQDIREVNNHKIYNIGYITVTPVLNSLTPQKQKKVDKLRYKKKVV